jgi:hypothetical protein
MLRALLRSNLRPRADLPHVAAIEHGAWREGWWQGIAIGFIVGLALAIVFFRR